MLSIGDRICSSCLLFMCNSSQTFLASNVSPNLTLSIESALNPYSFSINNRKSMSPFSTNCANNAQVDSTSFIL